MVCLTRPLHPSLGGASRHCVHSVGDMAWRRPPGTRSMHSRAEVPCCFLQTREVFLNRIWRPQIILSEVKKMFFTFTYSVSALRVSVWVLWHLVVVQGQCCGLGSEAWGSSCQVWQQAPLPTEPSRLPLISFLIYSGSAEEQGVPLRLGKPCKHSHGVL